MYQLLGESNIALAKPLAQNYFNAPALVVPRLPVVAQPAPRPATPTPVTPRPTIPAVAAPKPVTTVIVPKPTVSIAPSPSVGGGTVLNIPTSAFSPNVVATESPESAGFSPWILVAVAAGLYFVTRRKR